MSLQDELDIEILYNLLPYQVEWLRRNLRSSGKTELNRLAMKALLASKRLPEPVPSWHNPVIKVPSPEEQALKFLTRPRLVEETS